MSDLKLTDQERAAFCQNIDRNRALEYSYVFDNVPLHFVYHDDVITGELTEMEARNKELSETLWPEGYCRYNVCHVSFRFTCAPMHMGNMPGQQAFMTHLEGAGSFIPTQVDYNEPYRTAKEVRADFDEWMASSGWPRTEKERFDPEGSWMSQLGVPDRTPRAVSAIAVGNDVLAEFITSWSEDGVLKEGAWVSVLSYQTDGTVGMETMYADPATWPGVGGWDGSLSDPSQDKSRGVMDGFYDYHRGLQIDVESSDLEKRNLSIIQGAWANAQDADLDTGVYHPERFRMQSPNLKCSFNLDVLKEVEAITREAAPDKKTYLGITYAKGNQVVVEGYVSWTDRGVLRESPFISFLVLDADGLVIRERRYLTRFNWPGVNGVMARLGL